MESMPTLTKATGLAALSSNFFNSMSSPVTQSRLPHRGRDAARGLRTLNHAIEYLTDRYVDFDGSVSDQKAMLQAIHLLMSLQERVYSGTTDLGGESLHEPFWVRNLAG